MLDGFVQIEGFETYYVNKEGLIYSAPKKVGFIQKQGKFLKPYVNKLRWGYCYIGLQEGNKRKNLLHHRIVANAFLPKIEGKNQINHKDGNKSNNCIENLEWCTCSENQIHKIKILKYKISDESRRKLSLSKSRMIIQRTIGGEYIKCWDSVKDAINNGFGSSIYHCLRGETKMAYGYKWEIKK